MLSWRNVFIACVVPLAVFATWCLLDDRTRLTIFQPNGFIQSGEVLGIVVGDPRSNARQKLQHEGMVFEETQNGGVCFFRTVNPGRQVDIFFVKSWHGGMLCVVSRRERVEELIWAFQPLDL